MPSRDATRRRKSRSLSRYWVMSLRLLYARDRRSSCGSCHSRASATSTSVVARFWKMRLVVRRRISSSRGATVIDSSTDSTSSLPPIVTEVITPRRTSGAGPCATNVARWPKSWAATASPSATGVIAR